MCANIRRLKLFSRSRLKCLLKYLSEPLRLLTLNKLRFSFRELLPNLFLSEIDWLCVRAIQMEKSLAIFLILLDFLIAFDFLILRYFVKPLEVCLRVILYNESESDNVTVLTHFNPVLH